MNAITYSIQIDLNELSRLLTAATVSKKFRQLLLTNPKQALENGYNGEVFNLDAQDLDKVLSIQAMSLNDFARQLIGQQKLKGQDTAQQIEATDFAYARRNSFLQ